MDKYEFQIKAEQLEKLLERKDYKAAGKIADSIDWRKVHNVALLTKVSEVYENLERYEDCYEILNMAYDSSIRGKMVVYKMVEVAVKMGDFDEAVELYKEFIKIAPHDLGRYVLKYEIYRGRGSSIEDQIAILEEYKSREYQEQWAYELATLYYKEGMLSKCVEECDDLILWFSEGEYVVKAMELKMRIQPLTASQEEKYRQMADNTKAEGIKVKPVNMDEFNTSNLQAALAEGLQDFMREEQKAAEAEPEQVPETKLEELADTEYADAETLQSVQEAAQNTAAEQREQEEISQTAQTGRENRWEAVEAGEVHRPTAVKEDTLKLPRFLGQDESGQLTFNMTESVIERQITGQMTIEDILNEWEEKKKETEAAIAEAAVRDEERRKEREQMRADGKLPELNTEVVQTVPDEILRLIEEIEGRLPVKVHVEPILLDGKEEEPVREAEQILEPAPVPVRATEGYQPTEKLPEIMEVLEASKAASETALLEELDDIQDILEAEEVNERLVKRGTVTPKAEDIQQMPVEKEPVQKSQEQEKQIEKEQAEVKRDTKPLSPMMEDLERALEAEISTLPPGQLSEEQKKLFAYFTSVRGMNQQLAELLEEDRMRGERREDSLLGNIVITGEGGTGKSTLAADIVKALQKQRKVKGSKMAKIGADSLNGKSVAAVVQKLGGGALLIEKAGGLKTETAVQLSHAMTRKTGGLLVILEDEKEEIRKLFIRCESLGAKFTRTIEIPTFTNKELVAFGESYAKEQECVLDEMAVLALYNRIGNRQTSDHLVNVAEVKDMIDEAIDRGGKKGLFGKVKKSRMDEFGNVILLEKDFEE